MRTLLLFVAGILEDTARRLSETLQPCTHETNIAHVERDDGDAHGAEWLEQRFACEFAGIVPITQR